MNWSEADLAALKARRAGKPAQKKSAATRAMRILAIDPGPTNSAWVILRYGNVEFAAKETNGALLARFASGVLQRTSVDHMAVEMVACYGMPVGAEVFETALWAGRFVQAFDPSPASAAVSLVYRRDVKLHLCNSVRGNDSTIRQALIDRFGGKDKAIGLKASPGPLYAIKGDMWAALAVAVCYADQQAIIES